MDKLQKLPIWVVWKKEEISTPGSDGLKSVRYTKIPYQITGQKASSVNPDQWTTFEKVSAAVKDFDGIGFTISKEYPLLCIDLDHIIKEGEITREDYQYLVDIAGTYTELSPSGTGLHVIFELEKHFSLVATKKVNEDGTAVEAYTENRYFTFTGNSFGKLLPVRKISIEEADEILRMVGYPWGKKKDKVETVPVEAQVYTMTNDVLLKKMFKAKGGAKLERLYNGDISEYNDDASSADAALLTALAFWTAKNTSQMEEIWLESPLGKREKTQTRKDYRDRTIANVCSIVQTVYSGNVSGSLVKKSAPIEPVFLKEIILDGENSNKGIPHKNIVNVKRIIEADNYLANAFRWNEFSEMVETNIENGDDWLPYEGNHTTMVSEYIQNTYAYFENLPKQVVDDAIVLQSRKHKVNPPKDLIKSVEWDKTPRIEEWLFHAFGLELTDLNRAIASNWMKGLVNRVITPGCQFDTVLVLEGVQGIGKSSVLRALAEPWYAETIIDVDTKDFQLILTQNIVVEFSEGATLSRSQTEMLKQKITEREDNFRRPYDRLPKKFPRRCVFAMTTNQEQYLRDETGNRRWLPVKLPDRKADVEWIFDNKLQLFAEAYHRVYELKETTYEFPLELEIEQAARMEEDPWVTNIIKWYFDELTDQEREDGITTMDAYNKALWEVTRKDFTSGQAMRVAAIFRNHLELERRRKRESASLVWRYYATENTTKLNQIRNDNLTETEMSEKASKESRKFYEKDGVRSPISKDHF